MEERNTRCYFNVRSKADISQFNLPHGSEEREAEAVSRKGRSDGNAEERPRAA